MPAQFNYPTTILFGEGAASEMGRRLETSGVTAALLCTDAGVVAAGVAATVKAQLEERGLKVALFDQVHGNPIEEDVEAGVAAYRASGSEAVVGLGGGSPLDVAKAIAVLATHDGPISRFDDFKGGDRFIVNPMPPVFAIPTTAGTGSEVGRSAVIVARDTQAKTVVFHPNLLPRIAALDPLLTVGLPPKTTAATGLDAFTHGLEAYLAAGFHPMADAIALGCMELCIDALPRAVLRGDDVDARGKMLVAASMGATAFQKGLGVIHSLAHPLSTHYGIHHGLANALLMPVALSWQLEQRLDAYTDDLRARYQRVTRLFPGWSDAGFDALPSAIAAFRDQLNIPERLPDLGLTSGDIPSLASEAYQDGCHRQNPIPMTEPDLADIYRHCL